MLAINILQIFCVIITFCTGSPEVTVINKTNSFEGFTILAVGGGFLDVLKVLFEHVPDKNFYFQGRTALQLAIECDQTEVEKYLANVVDVNKKDPIHGRTPLYFAVEKGRIESMKLLLEHQANIDVKDKQGDSLLHHAVRCRQIAAVGFLLYKAPKLITCTNALGQTPAHIAAEVGDVRILYLLLKGNANINEQDNNLQAPLHIAAGAGHAEITEHLIKNGADPKQEDINGNVPLHVAAKMDRRESARILIKYTPATIKNSDGSTAVHLAAGSGHYDMVRDLLRNVEKFNEVDNEGKNILHAAVLGGNTEIVKYLKFYCGFKLDAKTFTGFTSLRLAAQCGASNMIDCLVVMNLVSDSERRLYLAVVG